MPVPPIFASVPPFIKSPLPNWGDPPTFTVLRPIPAVSVVRLNEAPPKFVIVAVRPAASPMLIIPASLTVRPLEICQISPPPRVTGGPEVIVVIARESSSPGPSIVPPVIVAPPNKLIKSPLRIDIPVQLAQVH